jgi:AraC family transcriptional regulator
MSHRPDTLVRSHEIYGEVLKPLGCVVRRPPESEGSGWMVGVRYVSAPYDVAVPALAVPRLSINLSVASTHGALAGDRVQTHEAQAHSMFLTPAGASARWRKEVSTEHINLYFQPSADEDRADALGPLAGESPLLNVVVPGCRPWIQALDAELRQSDAFTHEAVDSLGRLLLVALARGHHRQRRKPADALSPEVLHKLTEYVDSHLEQPLLVADLASYVGLRPSQFAANFLRRTGRTPHQFVISRRLIKVMDLLRAGKLSIADAALAGGFASQSHLTRVMRERVGLAPAQWLSAGARPGRGSF